MKTQNILICLTITIFFLVGCGGGQVNYSDILAHVEDTENYGAMELAKMDNNLSTFVELVEMSGLDISLEFTDSYTVFIPTNEAFADMDKTRYQELIAPQNRVELARFIKWHFLPNEVPSFEFNTTQVIQNPGQDDIPVSTDMNGKVIYVGGAQIVRPDIQAADGIVHIVNGVIQPTTDIIPQ